MDWLGVGIAEFYINGIMVHQLYNPNAYAGPYMGSAILPIGVDIQNTGASTAANFVFICASVESQGGQEPPKYTYAAYNTIDIPVSLTENALIAIRPGLTYRGVENRIMALPSIANVSTEGVRASYRIILNPTISGGTWISASLNNSGVEYNITISGSYSGGDTIYRGYLPNSQDNAAIDLSGLFKENASKLRLNGFATGQDTLLIVGINESAGTTNMRASINWKEIR